MLQEYWASTVIFIEIFSQCTISVPKVSENIKLTDEGQNFTQQNF